MFTRTWMVALILALGAGLLAARVADVSAGDVLQRHLDAVRAAGATGAQVRVVGPDGSVRVATTGVADVKTRAPVPPNGHYRIASNTKTFVATVMLQLADEGRLDLDDAVERYLPGVFGDSGYDGTKITIRHLLQHTSGIASYDDDRDWDPFASLATFRKRRYDHYELKDLIAVALRRKPLFQPGTEHNYANSNYILAGMIIERVTGNPWGREVATRIFEPLGLDDTSVPDDARMPYPHAKGYGQFDWDDPLVDVTELDPSAGGSGGAIISTPADMVRFFTGLLGGELLPAGRLAEMKRTVPAGDARYGLGLVWRTLDCGAGFWGHGGAIPGYLSFVGFTGERSVVLSISTMNADPVPDHAQGIAAEDLVEAVLCGRGG